MKKILLATTALVISAAAADAQAVRIGGEGRMGIMYSNGGLWGASDWAQENRLQFNFSVSVQADHGLSFGAFSRARITNGSTGVFSGSRVWVEANNFRLTFGNVDGAIRGAGTSHGYAGGCGIGYEGGQQCGDSVGLLASHAFASTGGGHPSMLRIDYSFGDTRLALSHQRDGSTEFGIRSTFDAFTVALGYANRVTPTAATGSIVTVSGHYNGGTWGAGLIVARFSNGAGATANNWALSGNVELGGGNLYGYVGRVFSERAYGLNYGYGLGGGATLSVGAERVGSHTTGSVGVAFNF